MLGSQFVEQYGRKGLPAWEAAAIALAREGALTPWPWVDLSLTEGADTVILKVQTDVLSIGPLEDHVRLPLTPSAAQSIANLSGALLPTPWLEYQIWRAASLKLQPVAMVPNQGANLEQYAAHSKIVDDQIRSAGGEQNGQLVAGIKKGVVVANFYKPGHVLLFGWYRAYLTDPAGQQTGPAPDVFDDGKPMGAPNRQPIQPKSNVHGDFYVDYSHGIRLIAPTCLVNGALTDTLSVYQSPTLWRLVNKDAGGPVKVPRYPSPVPVAITRPVGDETLGPAATLEVPRGVPDMPSVSEYALDVLARQRKGGV